MATSMGDRYAGTIENATDTVRSAHFVHGSAARAAVPGSMKVGAGSAAFPGKKMTSPG